MKRRDFITLIGGAATCACAARAQQPGRTYRLGVLNIQGRQTPQFSALFDELRQLGFVEGQNLIVDSRGYSLRPEQFPALAAELVKAGVDAILCGGPAAARAAQAATRAVPLLAVVDDMVRAELVPSLSHPRGNLTGISFFSTELDGKRQDLLMELVPITRHIAALADPNATATQNVQALRDAALARGVELSVLSVDQPERIVPAIDEAKRMGATALNVLASPSYTREGLIFLNVRRRCACQLCTNGQKPPKKALSSATARGCPNSIANWLVSLSRSCGARSREICPSSSQPDSSWSSISRLRRPLAMKSRPRSCCAPTR